MDNLPETWKTVQIGELADVKGGKRLTKGHKLLDSPTEYPYIRVLDFKKRTVDSKNIKFLSEQTFETIKNYRISLDDVYISIAGTIGLSGTIPADLDGANLTENAAKLCNLKNIDKRFLVYVLDSNYVKSQIESLTMAVTQPKLALFRIKSLKIPLPPLKTQKKIVEIIEKAEKLKEWRAEADELADEYLKSVFLEMFGTPVRNEKGWEMTNFKEIASIDKKSIKAELIDENSNYIGLEHIESKTGKILNISSAKKAGLKSNKYLFDDECVLYGKLRPYLNKVALPNFEGVCSTDILPIRPKEDKSNRYFIKYLLSLDYYIKKSTEQSTGANLPRISPKALESFKVYAPPITLQNQFAQIVQQIETLKTHQAQSKQEIDNLFNTLMQKAFKGELVC